MIPSQQTHIRPSPSLSSARAVRPRPFDVFMRIAAAENYELAKVSETEWQLILPGIFRDHEVTLLWREKRQQLDLILMFEGRTPGGRSADICRLLALINERLNRGHFDYWAKDGAMVYRDAICLAGGAALRSEQAMALLASALDAAERGYPACQYVVWAGKSPEDAIDAALFDLATLA